MSHVFRPATRPTMYFIGVTTRQSSINAIFPLWAERLQLGKCELRGLDYPLHDDPQRYRDAVEFIKNDPLSLGALVTTHKIDLCAACADQFDVLDPLTRSIGEIGSIFKRDGRLHGRAVDPWTSGFALQHFLPANHWRNGVEALVLGAGGAGCALTWHLSKPDHQENRPSRIHVVDRIPTRLEHVRRLHASWGGSTVLETHLAATSETAGAVMKTLPRKSLVVNATGVGKDTPGSPLPDHAIFPDEGVVWEFNYRGDLLFLEQARSQQISRKLHIEDGWRYFLLGWTQVIADVFAREIPPQGPLFEELGQIAGRMR